MAASPLPSAPPPIPANDNRPKAPVLPFPGKKPPAGLGAARRLLRLGGAFNPYLRALNFIWDLYDLIDQWDELWSKPGGGYNLAGWNKNPGCGGPYELAFGSNFGGCIYLGGMGPNQTVTQPVDSGSGTWIIAFGRDWDPSWQRSIHADSYWLPKTTATPPSIANPPLGLPIVRNPAFNPWPREVELLPPSVRELDPINNPRTWPLAPPSPMPPPLPFPMIPNRRDPWWYPPSERTERGPKPQPRPNPHAPGLPGTNPGANPNPNPGPKDTPGKQPDIPPGVSHNPRSPQQPLPFWVFEPNSAPRTGSNKHDREPPSKGVKEKKVVAGPTTLKVLRQVLGETTEYCDAMIEIADAIDYDHAKKTKGLKKKPRKPKGKSKCVWSHEQLWAHWDSVDWNKAIENLVKNHLQDKVLGALNQGAQKGAPAITRNKTPLPSGMWGPVSKGGGFVPTRPA